jgi:hypothetical protein
MKLVDNWKSAWKWFSIQIAVAGAAAQGCIMTFPDIKNWVGDEVSHCVGLLVLAGVVGARLVDQKKPDDK